MTAALEAGEPAISVDTKKKKLVGDFKNAGREYHPKGRPEPVRVHDFLIPELGRASPYGVYDIGENAGWVSTGPLPIRDRPRGLPDMDVNLLFRWFVGLSPDDRVWDATSFTKNRERLQQGDVLQKFMARLLAHPKFNPLLSDEHFSVDGTLIEAWASHKSFKPKDDNKDDDGSNR